MNFLSTQFCIPVVIVVIVLAYYFRKEIAGFLGMERYFKIEDPVGSSDDTVGLDTTQKTSSTTEVKVKNTVKKRKHKDKKRKKKKKKTTEEISDK